MMILLTGAKLFKTVLRPHFFTSQKKGGRFFSPFFSSRGFTLIEILLAVVILAAAASLIFPNLKGRYDQYQFENMTRNITSLIQYAKMRSFADKTFYKLVFMPYERKYQLFKKSEEDIREDYLPAEGKYGKPLSFAKNVDLHSSARNEILFRPDGSVKNFKLTLQDKNSTRIEITSKGYFGQIQMKTL